MGSPTLLESAAAIAMAYDCATDLVANTVRCEAAANWLQVHSARHNTANTNSVSQEAVDEIMNICLYGGRWDPETQLSILKGCCGLG
jgi:hypothetical protein